MARCCDALFLLAETEVAMTAVIPSHVKDKNCIFPGYQIFVTGKILVFHRCLYNKKYICKNIYISKIKCQISKQSYQKIHENYWHQEEKYVDENHWYFWKWVEWVCCCLTWAVDAFHKSGVILKLTNHHNRYLHDRETNVSEGILKCKWWITKIKQSFKSNTDYLLLKGFVLFIFSLLVSQPCSLSVSRLVSQPVSQSCVRLLACSAVLPSVSMPVH